MADKLNPIVDVKPRRSRLITGELSAINVIISQGERDMLNPTVANKELNKWCGTKGINYYESLDFLFKYAVPKLHKFGLLECSYNRELAMFGISGKLLKKEEISYRWRLLLESQILTPIDGYGNTPVLALFWAIWEAIK